MRVTLYFIICCLSISCEKQSNNITNFRTGTFETFLEDTNVTSTAIRNDSIQIETYDGVEHIFAIKWNSNFEYELLKINPKNQLDSTPFIVKITGVKDNSYTFKAHYKGSNFKQKGLAVKTN